ncbi:hypothetical protein [Mucilaginibacter celer]|uniref:hypothetical protein n=1 Tax=Mucilaginibacter celer TaxID=2305508 RepID=UPI0013CE868D|nr:hypothetical protein [Mucilaginibacter celer]
MELQKHLQIKRVKYEKLVRGLIVANAMQFGYSYNKDSVFLWGSESSINYLKELAGV